MADEIEGTTEEQPATSEPAAGAPEAQKPEGDPPAEKEAAAE